MHVSQEIGVYFVWDRAGLSAMQTFGKTSKLQDSVEITNFNFWMACLGYWKVTTNFILDRWRIQIQRSVRQHCCSSSSLRSFPICLLNKLFLLLLTLVTCIFTIWSWMASRIIIANMSVSYRIDWGRLAEIIVLHTVKSRAVNCLG